MKLLSWLGALVVCFAVAYGTASVLQGHPSSTPTAVTGSFLVADGGDLPHAPVTAIPSPSPQPHRTSAPTKPKAAPKAAPTAPVVHSVSTTAIVIRSTQQALINQDRARYGLRPLAWSPCLASIAYSNAVRMANQGYISHTNGPTRDLGCHLGNHAGENVGYWSGGNLTQVQLDYKLNTMFMNSPDHRANILSPYYHYVGTAWKTGANGAHYIAVEFS
jgi:uncharacterized protein YkwD